ncbi:hypothetical protein [Hymenobacter edaphi]|nr:hypothetical protein [Hymenobacter edaphi]
MRPLPYRFTGPLLAALLWLLPVALSIGQVQSNAGYSLQVIPDKVVSASVSTSSASAGTREALISQFEAAANKTTFRTARVGFDRQRKYGVLTDGDFSKAVGKDGVAPTTGSLGLNYAVFLPVTYGRRYLIAPAGSPEEAEPTQQILFEEEPERMVPWFSLNLLFSLGSRGDTLVVQPDTLNPGQMLNQREFGQSLLLPGSAAASTLRSATISGRWYPFSWWVRHAQLVPLSFSGDLSVATTRWAAATRRMSEVNIVSANARAYYTLFDVPAKDDNDFAMRADAFAGLTYRSLNGDIREEGPLLTQILSQSDKHRFLGYDVGGQVAVNAFRATATYSTFGGHVKGFSHGQFIFSVGFSSAFRFSKSSRTR